MEIKEEKYLRGVLVVAIIVSALVGAVFGYYGGIVSQSNGTSLLQNLVKVNPNAGGQSESALVTNIVRQYSPAVVSIVATKDLPVIEQTYINPFQDFCNDPFFQQFFGGNCNDYQVPQYQQNGTQKSQVSAGTGFVVRADGLILTNKHVVNIDGAEYTVITNDGKKYPAQVLARDPNQDLAIVKINATNLTIVKLGDSDQLQVGQTVIAIGNALGQFSNSVSKGIVSGLSRSITASTGTSSETLDKVIQTDAAINPGNSGGPLINLNGEVIGLNTAIVSDAQNVGFAFPINKAKKDIQNVEATGKISSAYLGVRYVLIDSDLQSQKKLPVDYGALISKGQTANDVAIVPGSPAAKAGLQENDIILEAGGKKISKDYTLAEAIQEKNAGQTINLKILRDGKEINVTVTLSENKGS